MPALQPLQGLLIVYTFIRPLKITDHIMEWLATETLHTLDAVSCENRPLVETSC